MPPGTTDQMSPIHAAVPPGHFPPPTAQSFTPPEPGTVPDDFVPNAAVFCHGAGGRTYFGTDGQPAGDEVNVDEIRREGDLTDLLDALSERSDPQGWWIEAWYGKTRRALSTHCTPGTTCELLWLVDRDGRAIRPWIPLDRSGAPKSDAYYATSRLPIVERTPHQLNVPRSTP
ncbi:hypothetical protein [Rhodococcus sp. AG1013]|uniref:hypothetical protein n=1 Tax=Rhodococcus sp. AG1013 TaxID=2183996 RepID=UPI0011C04FA5|nr:hypothetical protein [Rhodococcus sp. AG1013]